MYIQGCPLEIEVNIEYILLVLAYTTGIYRSRKSKLQY
jgi:hypothetical protein